ncbi:uncharacterized protein [Venturia canescens]|uniref:uncharacterized protein n=1 Tax=Venturia canescens TaxID=32260 RepID=UPI001C9CAC49|nr:uncharacterized protein LOC122417737 [Venturia canescens]
MEKNNEAIGQSESTNRRVLISFLRNKVIAMTRRLESISDKTMVEVISVRNRAALKADFFLLRTTSLEASPVAESIPFGAENFCAHLHYSNKLTRSSNNMGSSKLTDVQLQEKMLNFSSKYYKALCDQCIPVQSEFKTVAPLNAFMLTSFLAYAANEKSMKDFFLKKVGFDDETKLNEAKDVFKTCLPALEKCGFTLSMEVAHTSKNKPIDGFKWAEEKLKISYKESAATAEQENVVRVHSKLSFKPIWVDAFKSADTKLLNFRQHNNGAKDIKVPMMSREGLYRQGDLAGFAAKFIEIPLKKTFEDLPLSMFVIVMKEDYIDDADTFLHNICNMDFKRLYFDRTSTETATKFTLPKIHAKTIMCQVHCEELLERGASFTCTKATHCDDLILSKSETDFNNIFAKAVMKTFVSVSAVIDETGTAHSMTRKRRATARAPVRGRVPRDSALPAPKLFEVNRPYVMAIIAKKGTDDPRPLLSIQITGHDLKGSEDKKLIPEEKKKNYHTGLPTSGSCVII